MLFIFWLNFSRIEARLTFFFF